MDQIKAPAGAKTKKVIVGRGKAAKRGRTAGRGHDGQKSRSGGGVRPGFEGGQMPLYRRIAMRGFKNFPFKKVYHPVNLSALERVFSDGDVVNDESLRAKGLLKGKKNVAKILGAGEITKKLTVKAYGFSAGAAEKIKKAGGTVETVSRKERPLTSKKSEPKTER